MKPMALLKNISHPLLYSRRQSSASMKQSLVAADAECVPHLSLSCAGLLGIRNVK
jgi:hypothetical protein